MSPSRKLVLILPSRSHCSFGHRRATPRTPVEADTALYRSWHIGLFNQTASSCKARGTLSPAPGDRPGYLQGQDTNFAEPWRPLLKNAGTVSHKHYSCNGQRPHVHSTMPGMWCPWNEYERPPQPGPGQASISLTEHRKRPFPPAFRLGSTGTGSERRPPWPLTALLCPHPSCSPAQGLSPSLLSMPLLGDLVPSPRSTFYMLTTLNLHLPQTHSETEQAPRTSQVQS